jgi:hypothetical protein
MLYQLIQISISISIWRRNVTMCNHRCEMTLTKLIFDGYVMTRAWNLPYLNMWLLLSTIHNCNRRNLGSLILQCYILTVYFANNFTIFTAGTYYMLRTDGSVFHLISTDCLKMGQTYVFVYRCSRYVIFQRPQILRPWCYLPESQTTFSYEYIPETNVCVILLNVYMINVMTCKWTNVSIDLYVEVLCSIPLKICNKTSK